MRSWQEASPSPADGKPAWRQWLKSRLLAIPDPAGRSAEIRDALSAFLPPRSGRVITLFSPLAGEPDLLPLVARHPGFRWLLPRVEDGGLSFHPANSRLSPGAFGIDEPEPDESPAIPIEEIDLFLCPGLGFTREGSRLGRGKGFYDRVLPFARPDALRIGVAFTEQIVARLPCHAHDQRMTHLATPGGVIPVTG